MNIEIKDVSEVRKNLTVSLDKSEVAAEHQAVVAEFVRQARLPGFRPGKAPVDMIAKRFAKDIEGELRSKVLNRAYRDGLEKSKLNVLSVVTVDEGKIEQGLSAAVTFTLDLNPEFKLPDYKGLKTEVAAVEPTDAEVDALIENLRRERAAFNPVERAAAKGDYVKLSYEGKIDGKPAAEVVPDKQIYSKVPQTWEEVEGVEGVIPGLGNGLAGLAKGAKKDVEVKFPEGFHVAELAGKSGVYSVEVLEVRERVMPALDEAFLKELQVDSVDALKTNVRNNLKARKESENRAAQRRQVSDALAAAVDFPVPESTIETETQNVLRSFMEENMRRGVPQEEFEKNKSELYEGARKAAAQRAKVRLILAKIVEAEKIEIKDIDVDRFIRTEAYRSGERPEKIAKDLGKDRERVRAMQSAIVLDKALDLVVSQATVVTAEAKV